jgi:uncharacterized protein YukE
VKTYDKVQAQWKAALNELVGQIGKSKNDIEKVKLRKIVDYMRAVEMAVIVSEEAGEEEKFKKQKLDQMLQQNRTRADFAQRLQQIIDTYNSGGSSVENYNEELTKFTQDLKIED